MKKKIKQWLEELEEPYKTRALNNYDGLVKYALSLEDAIIFAFDWEGTEQGQDYWNKLYSRIKYMKMHPAQNITAK